MIWNINRSIIISVWKIHTKFFNYKIPESFTPNGAKDTAREIGEGLKKLGKIDSSSDIDDSSIDINNDNDSTDYQNELEKLYNKCVNTRVIAGLDTDVCIDPNDSTSNNNDNEDNNN